MRSEKPFFARRRRQNGGRRTPASVECLERRDCPAAASIQLSGPSQIFEGQTVAFFVRLAAPATRTEQFAISTADGSATAAADFQVPPPTTVTIFRGQREVAFRVRALRDVVAEPTETFSLQATGLNPGSASIQPLTIAIKDASSGSTPSPPPVTILPGISIADATVVEGNAGTSTANFVVSLTAAAAKTVRVSYATANGTASSANRDYQTAGGSISFAPGETSKIVSITVNGDTAPEADEKFTVRLSTPIEAVLRDDTAVGTIRNDDSSTPLPSLPTLVVSDVRVSEGNSGTVNAAFTVSLSAASSSTVTVAYATADGTATTASSDYVALAGSLTFAAGETSKIVNATVNGDTSVETDETFVLGLSNAAGATILDGSAVATIVNDDSTGGGTPPGGGGVTPPSGGGGFQIALTFATDVPNSVRTAARTAADRWQQIITGDLPDVTDGATVIDDITIDVSMGLLSGGSGSDGSSGTLAQAGVRRLRDGSPGLPWKSVCGVDPADVGNSRMVTIMTHEFGHALGFPSGRQFQSYISNGAFVGPNALREYKAFNTSATSVPMDNGAHWSEGIFGNELMTPTLNMGTQYLSRITVGALQDAGYTVDYSKADQGFVPYRLMATPQSLAAKATPSLATSSPFSAFVAATFASLPHFPNWQDGLGAQGREASPRPRRITALAMANAAQAAMTVVRPS